jgi:aminomethyltransferase
MSICVADKPKMVPHKFTGPGAEGLLSRLTPASLSALKTHQSTLAVFLHPKTGGIVDDTVITRLGPEEFYVVTNAGCRVKDLEYLENEITQWESEDQEPLEWEVLKDWGLIALQGPLSANILENLLYEPDEVKLKELYFGNSVYAKVNLANGPSYEKVLISRGGYTGEDGFEILLPPTVTVPFTEHLLYSAGEDKLRLAGLGARDSLRLEAGMCLYGHDIDDSTTPVEAGLGWTVGKDRREDGGFYGDNVILEELKTVKQGGKGPSRRRVGFIVEGAPAREGAEIRDSAGEVIGKITSGCPSPTIGKNIAMGYVKSGNHKAGTEVGIIVRHKRRKGVVTKMPFIETKYWKGTAPA